MDVAILFGELITTRRREYTWSIDLDPVNKADGMISYNRSVVQIPKGGPFPAPIIYDLEDIAVSAYSRCRSSLFAHRRSNSTHHRRTQRRTRNLLAAVTAGCERDDKSG